MSDAENDHLADTEVEQEAEELEEEEEIFGLREAVALTAAEISQLPFERVPQIVVLAGFVDAGKTTLAASLFERFQRGPYCELQFAGSESLLAFDERAYLSRAENQEGRAQTPRTSREVGVELLHLRVADEAARRTDLLLGDMSGELYEQIRDSDDAHEDFRILDRADHFVMLLDAEALHDPERRHTLNHESFLILRKCMEDQRLDPRAQVWVLFSKWDLVEDSQDMVSFENFLSTLEDDYRTRLGQLNLRFARIAARPDHPSSLEDCYGLDTVFSDWVARSMYESEGDTFPLAQPTRYYERYSRERTRG